ncbi:MAG: hypothetical protein Q8M24_25320 [Pseudolabrys sp.]|nr:hypothetical protein [Pseudolabrys sp.]MDP2298773.1 hypothetical protein [Pseudolabrys sp.]
MTFSDRREPSFDGPSKASAAGAQDELYIGASDQKAHSAGRPSRLSRVVTTAQIVGSLLAVPLGLASGYSMYKANFAVDTTCQNLRAGIVAMLDKNVDPATRRMLVRRDIATFEQSCGGFDPDAHAAFKTLLAVPAAAPATAAAPKLRSALPATDVARKSEPKVETKSEPKTEPKTEPKPEAKPAAAAVAPAPVADSDTAMSDSRWLAAVRQALVTHTPDAAAPVAGSPPAMLEAPAAKAPRTETLAVSKPAAPLVQLQPTWTVPAQTAPVAAVAPVATPVPTVDVPEYVTPVREDHPRPPAPITGPTPINGATDGDDTTKSRIGSWIAQIPLVGRVIEPRGN